MQLSVNVALLLAVATLWARRHTWRMQWETAATVNVALQAVYTALPLFPYVNDAIDGTLHRLTGFWNLEELVGIFCYLGGLTSLLYLFAKRLDWTPRQFQRFMRERVELPATLFVPLIVAAFIIGGCGDQRTHDLELVHLAENPGVALYWLPVHLAIIWILAHAVWALLKIRRDDRRSTAVVYAYLAAISVTGVCVALFAVDAFGPAVPDLRFLAIRAELASYAIAATYAWTRKTRYLKTRTVAPPVEPTEPEACPQG